MTLYTNSGELIIAMERFDGMLKSVSCGSPNMVLTFNSEASFQYAIHAWNWVNEAESNSFLLITNYAGCAPDEQRLPYYIDGLHYDEPNFTAYLHAERREWSDVALTFDLDVGTLAVPAPSAANASSNSSGGVLTRRQSGAGNWPVTSSFNQNLFSANISGITVGLNCIDCGTSGSIAWTWHISYNNGTPIDVIATVQPRDFLAALELQISASGTLGSSITKSLPPLRIPITGFGIPELNVYVGPDLEITFGFGVSAFTGKVLLSFGAKASLSNDAILTIDFLEVSNSQFSGWEPTLTPSPLDLQEQVSATIELYMQSGLGLVLDLFGE
jgi:hypothetical protein